MRLRRVLAILPFFAPLSALAQTYTPQEIRMEGADATNTADLLRAANLKPGVPVSVAEIEAAMQRLGDTGEFSDIHYSVDSKALVFKLTPVAAAASLPVRYANFVWWQPAELEKLVEARVPLFHGSLPSTGNLTDQVKAALVALLREKGIDARVTTFESHGSHGSTTALSISSPPIALGKIQLEGALPALKSKFEERELSLDDEDFDLVASSDAIRLSVGDVYKNAGYLDVATDPAVFSGPRLDEHLKASQRFLVDASAVVHPGEVYRISRVDLPSAAPLPDADVAKAVDLTVGAPASALALRVARPEMEKLAREHGYYGAKVSVDTAKDTATHTIAYTFGITLGEVTHLAGVDASALPAAQQQAFLRSVHPAAGVVVNKELLTSISKALHDLQLTPQPRVDTVADNVHHTATLIIKP